MVTIIPKTRFQAGDVIEITNEPIKFIFKILEVLPTHGKLECSYYSKIIVNTGNIKDIIPGNCFTYGNLQYGDEFYISNRIADAFCEIAKDDLVHILYE